MEFGAEDAKGDPWISKIKQLGGGMITSYDEDINGLNESLLMGPEIYIKSWGLIFEAVLTISL